RRGRGDAGRDARRRPVRARARARAASARAARRGDRTTAAGGGGAAPSRRAAPRPKARRVSLPAGIDGVVFDVDGTLLHADDPGGVHGAIETVAAARASGRRLLFFTNGTGRPPAQYADDLRALGFQLEDEEFMNPAVVAARYVARRFPGRSVLVLGGPGVVAPLRELGIETVAAAPADVVLVGWDDSLTYTALRAACDSVWAGAPLLATSTAPVFSVRGGPAPGWSGAIVAGIRRTTGARAVTVGKPSQIALREMCRALGSPARRTLVVGDDLDLELEMARRGGGPWCSSRSRTCASSASRCARGASRDRARRRGSASRPTRSPGGRAAAPGRRCGRRRTRSRTR